MFSAFPVFYGSHYLSMADAHRSPTGWQAVRWAIREISIAGLLDLP
jgi:hypothetical protein